MSGRSEARKSEGRVTDAVERALEAVGGLSPAGQARVWSIIAEQHPEAMAAALAAAASAQGAPALGGQQEET